MKNNIFNRKNQNSDFSLYFSKLNTKFDFQN